VSGGADSTALLLGLARLAPEFDLTLHAAHLHHGLRGREADGDLAFVRRLCRRLGLPLHAARVDARRAMRERGISGEAGLRVLRREFLLRAAGEAGAAAIATAHTADDQLETVLMRLARGTGLRGLGGMRPRHGRWRKPLLEATRAAIEADLATARQIWREDRSNRDPAHLRNRIRHGVVPAFVKAIAPAARPSRGTPPARGAAARAALALRVARATREVRSAEGVLGARARRVLSSLCRIQQGEFVLESRRLAPYAFAFQRAVLRHLWTRLHPRLPGLTDSYLGALTRLIGGGGKSRRIELPGGWRAERTAGDVRFRHGRGPHEPVAGYPRSERP
jgi:tRNA(Ile)-lysidine synthase